MPAFTYPASVASRTAAARRWRSCSGVIAMHCDSSMTFWLRRCMLQSRTPAAHTVPWESAISWTSTWRAPVTTRSMNTVASPNVLRPSALALAKASASSPSSSTRRIPRPPPPAVALIINGYPMCAACRRAASTVSTGPPLHGATGTSARSANSFAAILSPSRRMTSGRGPTNTTPSRSQSSANSGRSATNPHPTQAASAPAATKARSSVGRSRYGLPASGDRRTSRHTASSASRTNIAVRSARVCRAIVRMSIRDASRNSRTALIRRMAGSPRFTMAMRRSPRTISGERTRRSALGSRSVHGWPIDPASPGDRLEFLEFSDQLGDQRGRDAQRRFHVAVRNGIASRVGKGSSHNFERCPGWLVLGRAEMERRHRVAGAGPTAYRVIESVGGTASCVCLHVSGREPHDGARGD